MRSNHEGWSPLDTKRKDARIKGFVDQETGNLPVGSCRESLRSGDKTINRIGLVDGPRSGYSAQRGSCKCCQPDTEGHKMALIEQGEARGQPTDPQKKPPQSLGDLWNQPQVRRWALRAGLAVVVSVLFALAIDIRVGLTVAIIA